MRKFKHKNTGQIGELWEDNHLHFDRSGGGCSCHETIWFGFIENSNDWEEVVEKGYEILSFESTLIGEFPNIILNRIGEDSFGAYSFSEKELLKSSIHKIHSVKRLVDGEIFTVGDLVSREDGIFKGKLEAINDKFEAITSSEGKIGMSWLIKIPNKTPLFTTEDGVDIFKGDSYYLLTSDWKLAFCSSFSEGDLAFNCFSSHDKAKEFILMNKPCLSINDIVYGTKEIHPPYAFVKEELMNFFKNLVQNKSK